MEKGFLNGPTPMEDIIYEGAILCVATSLAASAAVLSTYVGGHHVGRDRWYLPAVGCLSGLITLGVVAIGADALGGVDGNELYCIGVSCLVGSLGKLTHRVAFLVLGKIGLPVNGGNHE